ncbi:MAG: 5'/3'-nucleotidase SurE [Bdellovibrionota bacterium]
MKILVTNDDGIGSRGIALLEELALPFGEVMVVAPTDDQSGTSHSLTLHHPLRVNHITENTYSVYGTPTDCVHYALLDLYGEDQPDIILSGINLGPNLGTDVWYSGTVGAAIEGALSGIPSIAFSLVSSESRVYYEELAQDFIPKLLKKIQKNKPSSLLLNVNLPSSESLNYEVEVTRLGSSYYEGNLKKNYDPRGNAYFWIGGDKLPFDEDQGTDSHAVGRGNVSITPLRLEMTDVERLGRTKELFA